MKPLRLNLARDEILPLMKGVTLERWLPAASLETLSGTREIIQNIGVSKAISDIKLTAREEAEASLKQMSGAAAPSDFKWHETPWQVLIALPARLHRHPLPTWFINEYAQKNPVS